MAVLNGLDVLCIRVLEDSPNSALFVVEVRCQDPLLLAFWERKAFFHNGQVEQTDTLRSTEGGDGLQFVLRVLHRSPRLSNAHYWSPFVMALCLDALLFRYHLSPGLLWNGDIREVMRENTLVLMRSGEFGEPTSRGQCGPEL